MKSTAVLSVPFLFSLFALSAATDQALSGLPNPSDTSSIEHRKVLSLIGDSKYQKYEFVLGRGETRGDGLLAYWPFNGNADDESGNGNHGTVVGAVLTEDRFGNHNSAYSFDGTDDYIGFPALWSSSPSEITFVAWFNHTGRNNGTILWHGPAGAGGLAVNFGQPATSVKLTDGLWYAVVSGFTDPYTWYFVCGVWEKGNNIKLYLNGVALDSLPVPDLLLFDGTGYPPSIGANAQLMQGTPFFGYIDEVRVYDRALTPAEIMALYNENVLASFGICYGSTGSSEPTYPGSLITIDPLTGTGTLIGQTGIQGDQGPSVPALAIKSTGEMYALSAESSSDLYLVNASTAASTFIGTTGLRYPDALAFDANDLLYAVANNNNLYTVDEATGVATLIGPVGLITKDLAYDPTDGAMYGCSPNDEIFTVDLATGAATLVGTTGLGGSTHALHFDQEGQLYGTKGSATTAYTLIAIDKVTGTGTTIGPIGFTAVIGLASRVVYTPPAVPVTVDVAIDSLYQFVPAEGDTFPYTMTFTNQTSQTQVIDWWTKVLRPGQDPIDPLSGPEIRVLTRFETLVVDTALLPVPFNALPAEYQLVAYIGRYLSDTLDTDTTSFTKLPAVPCSDIDRFQARCRPAGLMQARVIMTNTSHTGDVVEISIDQFPYLVTIGSNGRGLFSQTGFNPGVHTVELTDPPDCFPAITVTCQAGLGKEGEDPWEESWEFPITTTLLGNYPNPFNPSTTIRYGVSDDAHVTLKIYNMLGQLVKTLVDEYQSVGYRQVIWDGTNTIGERVGSGIYVYRMSTGQFNASNRMLLIK